MSQDFTKTGLLELGEQFSCPIYIFICAFLLNNPLTIFDFFQITNRIENLLESQYVDPAHDEEDKEDGGDTAASTEKKYLCFKRLTMIPIQKNLIDVSLMTKKELDWLDSYHQEVFEKVSPLLEEGSPAYVWLKKSTAPIERS